MESPVYNLSIKFAGFDESEDFAGWSKYDLERRVETVFLFDQTATKAATTFIRFVETHTTEQKTILVPRTVKIAVRTSKRY